jgi:hypothetical protein
MIPYYARGGHGASAAATVEVTVGSGGATGWWPVRGLFVSVWIRKTAGSATKFAWAVYSEDPAAPPGGEASEYILAAGLNAASGDERADCNNDAAIPDVALVFTDGLPWRDKSASALQKLWVVLTYDAGADNEATVLLGAAPNPDPALPQPPI